MGVPDHGATPLADDEIARAGVAGRRAMLVAGRTTAVGLLEASLRRIAALDARLGAFQQLFPTARAEAEAADARIARGEVGPLLGVPVAVKDSAAVTGRVQALGTASPQPPATADAVVVARLRAAGAVLVGSTRMPELALWPFTETPAFGATRNPWDPTRTPGGSSGGSAAAVAAGMVAAAHASDGGGSIRGPAACCGLVGLKPGVGPDGLGLGAEHWNGLSTEGCVTRTVADHAAVLGVLADRELTPLDPGRLLLAWSTATPVPQPVDPVVVTALHDVLGTLRGLGHDVVPADPDLRGVQASFLPRYLRGVAEDVGGLVDPSVLEQRVRVPAAVGRRVPDRVLAAALRRGREAAARLAAPPGGADVLLTPTLPGPVPRVGALTGLRTLVGAPRQVPFTVPWNVTGQPALSVPAGLDADGLPLAVQLVGRPGSEVLLLGLAAQLETALGWPDRYPPLG